MQFSNVDVSTHSTKDAKVNILYFANHTEYNVLTGFDSSEYVIEKFENIIQLTQHTQTLSINDLSTIIIFEIDPLKFHEIQEFVHTLKNNWITKNLITIFFLPEKNPDIIRKAIAMGISDCYSSPIPFEDVKERLKFLTFYKVLRSQVNQLSKIPQIEYQIPLSKRLLDIILSTVALICISPLLAIITALIKMDSPGPIFYSSKRVGTGYKIFDFYKFRSMRIGADAEVAGLANQNQYGNATFFKVHNDPRITKLGAFLRRTSIDELPQLLNVIKGEMSIVGNRPLPLYEAEQLTTNEWSMRFLGPAGLTGLWQISKRGKKNMSDTERKELDNYYAKNYSLWLDFKIIFKTIPALVQKEKV